MIEVKQNIPEDIEPPKSRILRSCCFNLDRDCVSYMGQISFATLTLCFCAFMLVKANGSCEQSSSYINIISFMLGKILSSIMTSNRSTG